MATWNVLVPVRGWATAKSRLGHLSPVQRATLARALAHDTVDMVLAAREVRDCWVVGSSHTCAEVADWGVRTIVVPDEVGLLPALASGAAAAGAEGDVGVAILVADLPMLTSDALSDTLAAVPSRSPAIVRDASGSGTVLLASRRGALEPKFGVDSARRHLGSGAVDLSDQSDSRLRHDLDTREHLDSAFPRPGSRVADWYVENVELLTSPLSRPATTSAR